MRATEQVIDDDLGTLQRQSFGYFIHEANPENGLVADKTSPDWPASIAATGFALTAYTVGASTRDTSVAGDAGAPLPDPGVVPPDNTNT